ncbi:hypothetical protein MAR_013184 [Mya arenaria]|uniref:Uncharacterized protein n=1 Tax=Mya arenaria TaxID=6604 RepID=A0ABY7FZT2_MYAAR|nr:hypothetical protein MAR_013184 [Mya arenaria]
MGKDMNVTAKGIKSTHARRTAENSPIATNTFSDVITPPVEMYTRKTTNMISFADTKKGPRPTLVAVVLVVLGLAGQVLGDILVAEWNPGYRQ